MTQDQWGQVKQKIEQSVGQSNFKNWIEPLEFSDVTEGVAIFEVPTGFIGNYVSRHFGDLILYQISSFDPQVRKLDFRVAPREVQRPAKPEATGAAATSQPVRRDAILPSAPLDDRFRFETFVVGKPNELAHAAAKRVAEGGQATFNPLFFYGGVGLGKTHLMHAIAWELTCTCFTCRPSSSCTASSRPCGIAR
jgi:chromosomal replication initiator protein